MATTPIAHNLTDYIQGHKGDQTFLARTIAPVVDIGAGRKFTYRSWGSDMFRSEANADLVAPDAPANRVRLESTLLTDTALQYKLGDFLSQPDRAEFEKEGILEEARLAKSDGVMNKMLVAEEKRLADLIGNTSNVPDTAATAVWGNGSATPIADIEAAIEAVRTASGFRANTLVIPSGNLALLLADDDIVDWRKRNAMVSVEDMIKAMFRLDRVIVPSAVYTSSTAGQTETQADIWPSSKLWVMWTPRADAETDRFDRRPVKTFVQTPEGFNGDGRMVDLFETPNPKGEEVIVYANYLHKIVDTSTIYMLTGCTS
jgi:hypothetical protein